MYRALRIISGASFFQPKARSINPGYSSQDDRVEIMHKASQGTAEMILRALTFPGQSDLLAQIKKDDEIHQTIIFIH